MGGFFSCLDSRESTDKVPELINVNHISELFTKKGNLFQSRHSSVSLVTLNSTGEAFALKELASSEETQFCFENEVKFLEKLDHPNIVGFEGAYKNSHNFFICTSICHGDCLIDLKPKQISRKQIKNIIRIVLQTIHYCHEQNVVHCDLKLDNLIFKKKNDYNDIMIIDWAEAMLVKDNRIYHDFGGSAHYLSPECKGNRRGWEIKKSDVFSIGVMAFALLTNEYPFKLDRNDMFPEKGIIWPTNINLSPNAMNFLQLTLEHNPSKRMSAWDALKHPWIS
jgi:myosin-light-chain kinase